MLVTLKTLKNNSVYFILSIPIILNYIFRKLLITQKLTEKTNIKPYK